MYQVSKNQNDNEVSRKNQKRSRGRIIRSVWFNKEAHPEKHYRELTMLFTSWRNEETDLIGNCSTFEQHFYTLKDKISKQMEQYAFFSEQLDQIQKNLNNIDEHHFDAIIAPNTQHTQLQDEAEGVSHLHPDLDETYDLSEDIGIPSVSADNNALTLNELHDQEYRQMVQKLNKEQKKSFFNHILHLIKTSDKQFYCFLSGGAGVGKSQLARALYQAALKYYNYKAGVVIHEIKVLLLAPKGRQVTTSKETQYTVLGNTSKSITKKLKAP